MALTEDRLPDAALFRREVVPRRGRALPAEPGHGGRPRIGGACQVELISYGDGVVPQDAAPRASRSASSAPTTGPSNPLDVVSWELPAAIADADLVHIHPAYTRSSEMGLLVAKQQRKPICVTDHGGDVEHRSGMNLGILELADRIVAYSDFGASLYRTTTPIEVIKGGVDGDAVHPARRHAPPRDRVLYVGRLLPHKGIDRLIEALPPELPLTVCGRPYHADYFRHLQALAAGKRVEFVTDADDATILDLYRRAWVNVLPSVYHDCYGNTLRRPRADGLHAPGGDGLRHARDLLAGRRRCPSSSATARPASSSTRPTS